MRMPNKKIINTTILLFTLILLFSTITYAKPFTDSFRGGLIDINDFFTGEQYKPYAKAIDFFFFSLLFIAIYMMGARYAFKEVKKPEQVIVILLGLMTAFLLVLGEFSATILLPYIQWLLYTLLFIFYWWLLKGIKSKFWRFILALLLTLLTIGLIQGLFGALSPDAEGFFKSLGKSFGAIQFPEIGVPGVPDWTRDLFGVPAAPTLPSVTTLPTTTTPTAEEPGKGGIFGTGASWWWVLLIPLLAGAGFGAWRLASRVRPPAPTPPTPPTQPEVMPEEQRLQKIIEEIEKIIELKQKILKALRDIMERKKKLTKEALDAYHKIISDPQFDPAFLLDVESEQYKKLLQENNVVTELLRLEIETERDLIKLRIIEELLAGTNFDLEHNDEFAQKIIAEIKQQFTIGNLQQGKLVEWSEFLAQLYIKNSVVFANVPKETQLRGQESFEMAPSWYKQAVGSISAIFKKLKDRDKGLVYELMTLINRFLLLAREDEAVKKELKRLLDTKYLLEWLKEGRYEKWRAIGERDANLLKKYFENEENIFYYGLIEEFGVSPKGWKTVKFTARNIPKGSSLITKLNLQMRYLQLIIELIKFLESKRKSFTQMQDLLIWVRDPKDHTKWADITQIATNPPGFDEQPFRITTNFVEGIPPFKVACYVNGQKKAEKTVDKNIGVDEPAVVFTSEEIGSLLPGVYKITVVAISARDTYRRRDAKTTTIYIRSGVTLPKQHQLSFKVFDHKFMKGVDITKVPVRDVVVVMASIKDKNNNRIKGFGGKVKIKCRADKKHGATLLTLVNGIVVPADELDLYINDDGYCAFNYLVGKVPTEHPINLEVIENTQSIPLSNNKIEFTIKTIERVNLGKGKIAIGILREIDAWQSFKELTPHIPISRHYPDVRDMHNKLAFYITKEGGVFVMFEWENVEVWDNKSIIVNGGFIHTGNKDEGFREIQPWEYVELSVVLARKSAISEKLSELDKENKPFGEYEGGEQSMFIREGGREYEGGEQSPLEIDSNIPEITPYSERVGSYKLFMLLNILDFKCQENGLFNIKLVYVRLIRFFAKKSLLLLSSLSAAEIADDKWVTWQALTNTTMYKDPKKRWNLPYYMPYTILGSEALKNPDLLDEIERRATSKFENNPNWRGEKFVVKYRWGSMGEGIEFFKDKETCLNHLRTRKNAKNYIVQEYIVMKNEKGYAHDYRVLVSGRKMAWAYERTAVNKSTNLANISQGGISSTLSSKEYRELQEVIEKYVVKHVLSANLIFSDLFEMMRQYAESHGGWANVRANAGFYNELRELAYKFKYLYQSAFEFYAVDISTSSWDGKGHYVFIELNISPGTKGVFANGMMDDLMKGIAKNLLEYAKGYHSSAPILRASIESEVEPELRAKKKPTIVLLADINKELEGDILNRIIRPDVRKYMQISAQFDEADIVCADIYNLRIKNGILYVVKGIVLDKDTPNRKTFVEKSLNVPVDYLLRKVYPKKGKKGDIDKKSKAYLSLVAGGVKSADTEWGMSSNVTRWFEQQGGPTLISGHVAKVCASKVETENAFIDYYSKYGFNINRPKTYMPGDFNGISDSLIKLKDEGYIGAVIKPSSGRGSIGLTFVDLRKGIKDLENYLRSALSKQIVEELRKRNKVIVQNLVENPYLINGRKVILRSILTPVVENGQITNINYIHSHIRLGIKTYDYNPENEDAQVEEEDIDTNTGSFVTNPIFSDYLISQGEDYTMIVNKIREQAYYSLRAVFAKAISNGEKSPSFDIAPFDILLSKDPNAGELIPFIIEINSQGQVFWGNSNEDNYIMSEMLKYTFPLVAKHAKIFLAKRRSGNEILE